MIKLARGLVERLFLVASYCQYHGFGCDEIQQEGLRAKRPIGAPSPKEVCREVYNQGFGEQYSDWSQLIDPIVEGLVNGPNAGEGHHPTLIEMMVEILQGPYARQALTGHALRDLRRAVLLPQEMSKVGEALRKESGCAACGRPFHVGEMATANQTDEGSIAFFCIFCIRPQSAPCSGTNCQNTVELEDHLFQPVYRKIMEKHRCPDHDPNALKKQPEDPQAALARDLANVVGRIANVAEEGPWQQVGGPGAALEEVPPVWRNFPEPPPQVPQPEPREFLRERGAVIMPRGRNRR